MFTLHKFFYNLFKTRFIRFIIYIYIFFGRIFILNAQSIIDTNINLDKSKGFQQVKPFLGSSALIGIGSLTRSFKFSRKLDYKFNDFVIKSNIKKTNLDDFLPYSPIVALYGFEACGIKSRSGIKTMTLNLVFSQIVSGLSVYIIKNTAQIERPDKSNKLSFPSGHTSLAFVSAQVLVEEYGHHSIWIPISAYTVASTVGILRITNNKHWLTDVITGAGIGILSTKIVYHINLKNKRTKV